MIYKNGIDLESLRLFTAGHARCIRGLAFHCFHNSCQQNLIFLAALLCLQAGMHQREGLELHEEHFVLPENDFARSQRADVNQ